MKAVHLYFIITGNKAKEIVDRKGSFNMNTVLQT